MAWGCPGVSGSGGLAPQDRGVSRRGSRGCSLSVGRPHGRTSQCPQPCKGGAEASPLRCFGTPSSFPSCKGGHWEYSDRDCMYFRTRWSLQLADQTSCPGPAPNLDYHLSPTRKTKACKTGLKRARTMRQSKESQRAARDRGRKASPWEGGASKELLLSGGPHGLGILDLQGTLVALASRGEDMAVCLPETIKKPKTKVLNERDWNWRNWGCQVFGRSLSPFHHILCSATQFVSESSDTTPRTVAC